MTNKILTLLVLLMIIPTSQAMGKSSSIYDHSLPLPVSQYAKKMIKTDLIKKVTDLKIVETSAVSEIVEKAGNKVSGIVSWYADKFHGRKTSSGELYNKNNLTAAHKTLPFGTKVKVTNTKNGKSVVVRINDRGPFSKSRELDLSYSAFKEISSIQNGLVKITYEVVE